MNLVVSNMKGGVGKTTTAIYLAAAAASAGYGPVLLVDADRQASAAEWLETRPIDGVDVVEAPSERTLARAARRDGTLVIIDTPPGDERIVRTAMTLAEAIVIPTRAAGVEYRPAADTFELADGHAPTGMILCAARLGTNDLETAIAWWGEQRVPLWGVIPERVAIASGPEARLSQEGLELYGEALRKATRGLRIKRR